MLPIDLRIYNVVRVHLRSLRRSILKRSEVFAQSCTAPRSDEHKHLLELKAIKPCGSRVPSGFRYHGHPASALISSIVLSQ